MPRAPSKSTEIIQRLLEERRQYEAWIVRLNDSADATPGHVRARVRSDYEARLAAVTEELKAHAESARQAIEEKRYLRGELQKKEARAAEKLTETELRHAVGEYDESQWAQVHKDVLAAPTLSPPSPQRPPHPGPEKIAVEDELAFIKSVTEDDKSAPSERRASGAQFQPVIPGDPPRTPMAGPRAATPAPEPVVPEAPDDADEEAAKTLQCRECGTMNLPTEWYCE